ncbi:MAG TPA: hypothetical protein PKE16_14860 [Hyphomicrobium sp.]|nr:hypothetical protein [Hyphomicrobium sp.]
MRPIIVLVILLIIGSIWYLQPFRPRTIDADDHAQSQRPSPTQSAPEPYPINPTPPPPDGTIDKKAP